MTRKDSGSEIFKSQNENVEINLFPPQTSHPRRCDLETQVSKDDGKLESEYIYYTNDSVINVSDEPTNDDTANDGSPLKGNEKSNETEEADVEFYANLRRSWSFPVVSEDSDQIWIKTIRSTAKTLKLRAPLMHEKFSPHRKMLILNH